MKISQQIIDNKNQTSVCFTSKNNELNTNNDNKDEEINIDIDSYKKQATTDNLPHFRIDWRNLTYYRRRAPDTKQLFSLNNPLTSILSSNNHKHKTTNKQAKILNSLDGCFKSGELSAILGPSGAGKSTFIDCLFGRRQDEAFGQTKVTWLFEDQHQSTKFANNYDGNNQEFIKTRKALEKRELNAAIVPQDDFLIKSLTVFETLMFASKIKHATRTNNNKKSTIATTPCKLDTNFHRANVLRVARNLKLNECLQVRCNKLSGGQRKRVCIGQEFLSEPNVIVLDEPTSGLDSLTCVSIIKCLKKLAKRHRMAVVLTIHQPDNDVFNLFDSVYVIAQGGFAIYEGPPQLLAKHMLSAGLKIPIGDNPARFIIENSFCPQEINYDSDDDDDNDDGNNRDGADSYYDDDRRGDDKNDESSFNPHNKYFQDEEKDECYPERENFKKIKIQNDEEALNHQNINLYNVKNGLARSLLNLADSLVNLKVNKVSSKCENIVTRPLINLGVKTSDGEYITRDKLKQASKQYVSETENNIRKKIKTIERQRQLLIKLNEIQKEKYKSDDCYNLKQNQFAFSSNKTNQVAYKEHSNQQIYNDCNIASKFEQNFDCKSEYFCSLTSLNDNVINFNTISESQKQEKDLNSNKQNDDDDNDNDDEGKQLSSSSSTSNTNQTSFVDNNITHNDDDNDIDFNYRFEKKMRNFDKRLSCKQAFSKRKHPTLKHSIILTHRTWLSIIRDPIFFGIQLLMHTLIPLTLGGIYGSKQDDGCPLTRKFDIVEFAYADNNAMLDALLSIQRTISNVGIVFFQMFILCLAINCITALVFPLDMHILAKEFRNGWYNPIAYMIARTIADLPIPVLLHTAALALLYFITGQAHSMFEWRFFSINAVMILASLVAQSVGLTVGAILMKSQQAAVLMAAGMTAPTFALSGYIVRVSSLNYLMAALANSTSYLYHLLNAFIILRYGFSKCTCEEEDFELTVGHELPKHLNTMASVWVGTFSNEYPNSKVVINALAQRQTMSHSNSNNTNSHQLINIDPNIDIVAKLIDSFSSARSFGEKIESCRDVIPYPMLNFNLRDSDLWFPIACLCVMVLVSRILTFFTIFYKIRSQI